MSKTGTTSFCRLNGLAVGEQLQADQMLAARVARDTVMGTINSEDAGLATTNAELDWLAEARRTLVHRWAELGQTGDPDKARVAQLPSQIAGRNARAEPIPSMHTALINGLRIWQNDQQFQDRCRAIAATLRELRVTTEIDATEKLQADMALARAQLELAQRARDRMEDVGTKMQTRAEEFAEEVLQPLNDTI